MKMWLLKKKKFKHQRVKTFNKKKINNKIS